MYGRGLEVACAIGETTRRLARVCLRLLAVDSSLTALNEARLRLAENKNVSFRQALLPAETPRGPFDLIVASEIALSQRALALRLFRKVTGCFGAERKDRDSQSLPPIRRCRAESCTSAAAYPAEAARNYGTRFP